MRIEKLARHRPLLHSLIWLGIILFVFFFMVRNVFAQEPTPAEPGNLPVEEQTSAEAVRFSSVTDDQVNAIAKQLYCPVCENIPLDVCPTQACAQWRELIREKLAAGWSEKQIKDYFVDQYGARVLGAPPVKGINWLVYLVPPAVILAGVYILYKAFRAWKPATLPEAHIASGTGGEVEKSATAGEAGSGGSGANDYIKRLEEELRKREQA